VNKLILPLPAHGCLNLLTFLIRIFNQFHLSAEHTPPDRIR